MAGRSTQHRLSDPVPYEYDLPPSPTTRLADPGELASSSTSRSSHELRTDATWAARNAPDESVPSSLESSQHVDSSAETEGSGYSGASMSSRRAWKLPVSPEDVKRHRQFNSTSHVQPPDKRFLYGSALGRQSSVTYPIHDVSRQMQGIGVSSVSGSSLPGAFGTPARNPSLRKDSLRSVTSPSGIRMDRAALAATGFSAPRAPQLSKFDTPVCEYDGTPLGVGLGGFSGMRDGLALGRKNSLNRIIMDEGLARQLEVEKVAPPQSMRVRRHTSGIPHGHSLHDTFDDTSMEEASTSTYVSSNDAFRRRLNSMVGVGSSSQSMASLETRSRIPRVAEQPQDTEMRHGEVAEEADQWQKPDERFLKAQKAAEDEAAAAAAASEESRPSKPKHIVTPSNKRMGFELEPAREVVTGDMTNQDAMSMLNICVLAVESIWPQSRTRDDWSRNTPSATGGSGPSHGVLPLSHFVREVLRRSRTLPNTLQIALYYLHQSRRSIRARVALADVAKRTYKTLLASGTMGSGAGCSEGQPEAQETELQTIMKAMSDPVLCGRRMFLASLMCASKYLQDRNFSNRAWAKISGLPVKEVNANERTFLFLVDYRLHIELDTFNHWIVRLRKLADDKGASPSKPQATNTPIKSPLKPAVPDAAMSTPSMSRQPGSAASTTTNTPNVASPVDRLAQRNRALPPSFTETLMAAESASSMSRPSAPVAVAISPRVARAPTLSNAIGSVPAGFDVPTSTYRSRRPTATETNIAVPTYSDLMAERELSLAQRRREEQELQSLRAAERAATLTALRVREERIRHEERARSQSIRRAQRDRDEGLHHRQQQQHDHLAAASAAASTSYRRGFRPSAGVGSAAMVSTANVVVGDDDMDRSDMDMDLSGIRDRPPSSCGMQDSTSSLMGTTDLPPRSGHGITAGLDDYGHRLNHLNHHHNQYGVTSRWGAPPHIY